MSNLYGSTTKLFSTPYITIAEYKQAPTAIDYNNLVADSADPAVQDAELANVIARASSWVDTYCNQVLAATIETETQRSRLSPDGSIQIHPRYFPIIALTELSFGQSPTSLQPYPDPSQGWIDDQSIVLPASPAFATYSSTGPLQLGVPAIPRAKIFVKYSYVNGYANTFLASNTSVGATTITVKDGTGVTAGGRMTIYDGANTENIVVADNYVFGSNSVPLVSPLTAAHLAGISVSALPPAVKQATILATTAFLKVRGDTALTMQVIQNVSGVTDRAGAGSLGYDLKVAQDLLKPFRRVR